jgi:hypothetical protein
MVADPAELGVLLEGNCAGEREPDSSHMLIHRKRLDSTMEMQ